MAFVTEMVDITREAKLAALGAQMDEHDSIHQTLKDVVKLSALLMDSELYRAGHHKDE